MNMNMNYALALDLLAFLWIIDTLLINYYYPLPCPLNPDSGCGQRDGF